MHVVSKRTSKCVRVRPGFSVRVDVARRQRLLLAKAMGQVIRQLDHDKKAA